MKRFFASLLLCTTAFAAGPHSATQPATAVRSLDVYHTPTHLHLLTATGTPARLTYQRSANDGASWTNPVEIAPSQPPPSPIRRGMDAQLAASPDGQTLLAAWTTAGAADRFGRGPIATAYSHDAGATWHPGPNPADDNDLATGHAFLDLACSPSDGSFHVVWLDGRDGPDSGKGLRYARSTDAGRTWSKNQTLDPQTCECCWNTLKATSGGKLAVLYRDKDCRDMAVLTSSDNGHTWSPSTPVGAFKWDVNVCPHVGGGLAFSADARLLATVWTGSPTHFGAYALTSPDSGRSWSPPTKLPHKPRHTDLATHPADPNRAALVYDTTTDTGPAVLYMTSSDAGETWSHPIRLSSPDTTPTHPRLVPTKTGFRAFWTDATTWVSAMIAP